MRTLFTLGAIVAAMLVPWTSLAPNWLPDAAGSPVAPSSTKNAGASVSWLNPALGIMPLGHDDAVGESGAAAQPAGSPRVVCENGVCRVVDESTAESIGPTASADANLVASEDRLQSLGATQLRVESGADGDESRAACAVPVAPGSKVRRRFEAIGATDSDAMTRLVEQIEAWLAERQ